MSKIVSHHRNTEEEAKPFDLYRLTMPHSGSHIQAGSGLCSNGHVLLFQDGSTVIEFRTLPEFKIKRLPWRYGLVRDIVWSSHFNKFILLTRDAAFNISPESMLISQKARNKPIADFTVNKYNEIKPFNNTHVFWRCTSTDNSLYIIYSGLGTVMEEYTLQTGSGRVKNRWHSPQTCAPHEGIWCIRHHPDIDQLGFTIIDSRTKEWRLEVRNREQLTVLWRIGIPLTRGDAELSIIPNSQWLIVNAVGLQLAQISYNGFKSMINYDSELRNAIVIDNSYFIVRTKSTLDIHVLRLLK